MKHRVRAFRALYLLDDGTRGVLHVIAPGSFSAWCYMMDLFGEATRYVSVRRAGRGA